MRYYVEGWFELFRKGRNEGMKAVYERFYSKLEFYANRYLGDENVSADVCQTAMRIVWERRDSYVSPLHLKNSLYLIVRNQCISLLRKRVADGERLSQRAQLQLDAFDVNTAVDPDRARAKTLSRLWDEVERHLGKRDAGILKLQYEEGLRDEEIAGKYGIAPAHVRLIRYRAFKKLKTVLNKKEWLLLLLLLTSNL